VHEWRRSSFLVLSSGLFSFLADVAAAQCLDWQPGFNLPGVDGRVGAFAVFDDGTGPALYVGGSFVHAGDTLSPGIVRWDGASWSPLGPGLAGYSQDAIVHDLAVFDDGSGPALYVTGWFAGGLARWNGTSWSSVGNAFQFQSYPYPQAMAVYDDGSGPALYVGGDFHVPGDPNSWGIARWDGTSWSSLGVGLGDLVHVNDLVVFDDGSGPALYAAGRFATAGGVPVLNIAKWDGSTWSPVGAADTYEVSACAVFDDGTGSALYVAGGSFTWPGGGSATGIARWDGTSWSALAVDPGVGVGALKVYDDGSGPALYAGGGFFAGGVVGANGIARWDGATWTALGQGLEASESPSGFAGEATALEVFDDGSGPALFAGGGFDWAGGTTATSIAKWSASSWTPLGSGNGLRSRAEALAFFDDGQGLNLYAGRSVLLPGGSTGADFLRFDGAAWTPVGGGIGGGGVVAMTVHDDGQGPALYVGGTFTSAGGASARRVARWDGQSWSPLGSGFETPGGSWVEVHALKSFDDGTGPALYAGGYFTQAGGTGANYIARWDGTSWSPLGAGLDGAVQALEVFDDGTGPALFVGGYFNFAGGAPASHVAKWDGTGWSTLALGVDDAVECLAVVDLGSGPSLFAGGSFLSASGAYANYVARWNGSTWTGLAQGPGMACLSLIGFDDGWGTDLYAGGFIHNGYHPGLLRWDGSGWRAVGSGLTEGDDSFHFVSALAAGDLEADGIQDLYLGGNFSRAGTTASVGIAAWRGCIQTGTPLCAGDGAGAPCPCGNDGWPGNGCSHSVGNLGARLDGAGIPSLGSDTLELLGTNVRPNVLCLLFQGDQRISPVFDGDGLRCTGGLLKRLYVRQAQGGSLTVPGPGDLSVSARSAAMGDALSAGDRRIYQIVYRDHNPTFCPDPQGATWNLSSALVVGWLP
jgi:hypothetical protein